MQQTPIPRRIPFSKDQIKKWGVVPARDVCRIANRCTSGADWGGSNKRDIYKEFENPRSDLKPDRDTFIFLMDRAAVACAQAEDFRREAMVSAMEIAFPRSQGPTLPPVMVPGALYRKMFLYGEQMTEGLAHHAVTTSEAAAAVKGWNKLVREDLAVHRLNPDKPNFKFNP